MVIKAYSPHLSTSTDVDQNWSKVYRYFFQSTSLFQVIAKTVLRLMSLDKSALKTTLFISQQFTNGVSIKKKRLNLS